jgi:hypothetical protein
LDIFEVFETIKITTHGTIKKNNNPLEKLKWILKATVDELFGRMQQTFNALGTEKFNWGASSGAINDPALNLRSYQAFYEKNFPADKYDIMVDSSLNRVNDIKKLNSFAVQRTKCLPQFAILTSARATTLM